MGKLIGVLLVCAVTAALSAACAGPLGKGEGDSCSGADDCSSNLTCQHIQGRDGDYCCPTPQSASKEANCQTK
jgi:hypothetical protein